MHEEVELYTHEEAAYEADRSFAALRGTSAVNYVLRDGPGGPVVYVGQTCRPHARFREHRHPWMQKAWERGRDLRMVIVRIVNLPCRRDQVFTILLNERDLIAAHLVVGDALENQTDGGDGRPPLLYLIECPCSVCAPWR